MRKDHSSTRRRVLLALAALSAARIAGAAVVARWSATRVP